MTNNNIKDDFLNKLNKKLDTNQEAALKVEKNAVIAAGAGSGKTQVLATRFAWLIMTGQAKVDEILTLTFTNKAAAEMYQRIYQTLTTFAYHDECEEISEKNRELAKTALENFSNAHIQTLDSYCGKILRQCASKYGIKPDFTTGSEDCARNIKTRAFRFVLQHKDDIGIQTFAKPGKLQDFAEKTLAVAIINYTSLVTEDDYFTKKLDLQLDHIVKAWNYYILGDITAKDAFRFNEKFHNLKNIINDLESCKNANIEVFDSAKGEYKNAINKIIDLGNQILNFAPISSDDVTNYSENIEKQVEILSKLRDPVVMANSFYRNNFAQPLKPYIQDLKNEQLDFYNSIVFFVRNFKAIKSLNNLFNLFLQETNNLKRNSGTLSFKDVGDMSIQILKENKEVRNQEKNSFKKIMIDEFQDNNSNNRDLLYLLSLKDDDFEYDNTKPLISQIIERDENNAIVKDHREQGKLFFVGDEKQSIYKFRGADVSVFNELTKDPEENKLISMNYNYRSNVQLLKAFNLFFSNGNGIFESYDDNNKKEDYEAYYNKDALKNDNGNEVQLPQLNKDNVPIHINLLESFGKDEEKKELYVSEKEQIAFQMAKKLLELKNENNDWKDFAILEKSRTDSGIITKYLNMFHIPYSLDQFNNIFDDGIINDFYNFLRLCVYPSDINSYGAYLTSPFCGVNVNAAEIILSHLVEAATNSKESLAEIEDESVLESIKTDLLNLDSISWTKYNAGREFYKENKSLVLQQQITTTLSYLWNNKGYKYESYLTEKTQLIAEHFDMFFELGRNADETGKSISWFVDQLAILKENSFMEEADIDVKSISYPYERSDAVNIMTIHKSKGLEFDNVFIYGCVDVSSRADRTNVFYDETTGISIKPDSDVKNYFSIIGEERYKQEELAEFRRQIYVAVTRAEESVYIFGSWSSNSSSTSPLRLIENLTRKFYGDVKYQEGKENKFFSNKENVSFDYTIIAPKEYKYLVNNSNNDEEKSIDEIRETVQKNTAKFYENSEILENHCNPIPHKSPSSLENSNEQQENSDIKIKETGLFKIDSMLTSSFKANDFGTLAHAYLEAQANNTPPEDFSPEPKLLKLIDPSHIKKAKKICEEMCLNFKNSQLGIDLEKAKSSNDFYKAEWGFRMKYDNSIYSGSIDLIYSTGNGKYSIVDYKTDKNIDPEIHRAQQECYRTAAANLLDVSEENISLYLYYLRHDKVVSLDK